MGIFDGFVRSMIEVGDTRINVRVRGDGPPVLLLHGYPQNMALWAHVAQMLAADYTVVCTDLRGYGDSLGPSGSAVDAYSFRAMATDQVAVMENLGFDRFAVVGHDRGARTAHRLTLDHPDRVTHLGVLDIMPTLDILMNVDRAAALAYWHWYFLATPAPFPETLIGADPDFFFETCISSIGATNVSNLDPDQVAEYRRTWRLPSVIHASCQDYRAAVTIDLEHELADADRVVQCPTLAAWGSEGKMGRLFDLRAIWESRCAQLQIAKIPGGHFFVDEQPVLTAKMISDLLETPGVR
ncbi:alpha/beta hydrolase [Nocardia vinacea]|uniref:alpha/beta fold hydrolase n=1 Tax=Nocardia vinacea TaxID=96468 RepID=UPI00343A5BC7